MASRAERRRRITDLYTIGEVLQVAPGEMVFLKKLNQFEDAEARADALAARSRTEMVLRDPDNVEHRALAEAVGRMDLQRLVDGIVSSREMKYMSEAGRAVQADPEWAERLLVLDRTDYDTAREEERKVVDAINVEYMSAVDEHLREARDIDRADLMQKGTDEVRELYQETVVEMRSSAIFIGEYKYGQIAWSVRMCDAEQPPDGAEWDHSACRHERLYVDEEVNEAGVTRVKRAIEFVREEPDALLDEYIRAFDRLHVSAMQVKGSASRQSSSEPSRQPSEEEESAPSTPEGTSSEPVTTSA